MRMKILIPVFFMLESFVIGFGEATMDLFKTTIAGEVYIGRIRNRLEAREREDPRLQVSIGVNDPSILFSTNPKAPKVDLPSSDASLANSALTMTHSSIVTTETESDLVNARITPIIVTGLVHGTRGSTIFVHYKLAEIYFSTMVNGARYFAKIGSIDRTRSNFNIGNGKEIMLTRFGESDSVSLALNLADYQAKEQIELLQNSAVAYHDARSEFAPTMAEWLRIYLTAIERNLYNDSEFKVSYREADWTYFMIQMDRYIFYGVAEKAGNPRTGLLLKVMRYRTVSDDVSLSGGKLDEYFAQSPELCTPLETGLTPAKNPLLDGDPKIIIRSTVLVTHCFYSEENQMTLVYELFDDKDVSDQGSSSQKHPSALQGITVIGNICLNTGEKQKVEVLLVGAHREMKPVKEAANTSYKKPEQEIQTLSAQILPDFEDDVLADWKGELTLEIYVESFANIFIGASPSALIFMRYFKPSKDSSSSAEAEEPVDEWWRLLVTKSTSKPSITGPPKFTLSVVVKSKLIYLWVHSKEEIKTFLIPANIDERTRKISIRKDEQCFVFNSGRVTIPENVSVDSLLHIGEPRAVNEGLVFGINREHALQNFAEFINWPTVKINDARKEEDGKVTIRYSNLVVG